MPTRASPRMWTKDDRPLRPALDYLPEGTPDAGADAGLTAEQVRTADIAALFVGLATPNIRVTRVRSDIVHAAMTADLVFQASADQSELSNVRTVTQSVNLVCPVYSGCNVVSSTTISQLASGSASGSTALGTSGSSTVGASGSTSSASSASARAGGGGCGCTAVGRSASGAAGFGAFAGVLGLLTARVLRRRRRGVQRA
jgi:hypothetical protein